MEENSRADQGVAVMLPEPFRDGRGVIQNLVLGEDVGCVSVIYSHAQSVRSQHYHLTDSHWLYVISGQMEYLERPVGAAIQPAWQKVGPGQMVYTGPMVEHATFFPVETVVVSVSRRPRDHESHEQDVVRVNLLEALARGEVSRVL